MVGESSHTIMAKVLPCYIVVSEFKLQLFYYIYFQTYTFWKGISSLNSSRYGLSVCFFCFSYLFPIFLLFTPPIFPIEKLCSLFNRPIPSSFSPYTSLFPSYFSISPNNAIKSFWYSPLPVSTIFSIPLFIYFHSFLFLFMQ